LRWLDCSHFPEQLKQKERACLKKVSRTTKPKESSRATDTREIYKTHMTTRVNTKQTHDDKKKKKKKKKKRHTLTRLRTLRTIANTKRKDWKQLSDASIVAHLKQRLLWLQSQE
jgi:hypothetical protein